MSFPAFCGYFYQLRIFFSGQKDLVNFMRYDDFKELISGFQFPGRFNLYIENTFIPTQEEAEEASGRLTEDQKENDYQHNYNNMIFLQKKVKTNFKKKELPVTEPAISADEDFPKEP